MYVHEVGWRVFPSNVVQVTHATGFWTKNLAEYWNDTDSYILHNYNYNFTNMNQAEFG